MVPPQRGCGNGAPLQNMGERCELPHWGQLLVRKILNKRQPGGLLQTKVVPTLYIVCIRVQCKKTLHVVGTKWMLGILMLAK